LRVSDHPSLHVDKNGSLIFILLLEKQFIYL